MNPLNESHEPTPEFLAHLEWQIQTALRREDRLTSPVSASRRRFGAALVITAALATGGIAGIDETLTVHQGGGLELVQRGGNAKSVTLDEPMIQPVRRMLEQREFGELAPTYQAVGADLIAYTITARDANGNAKTVTTMDGANPPPYLGQLVAMFEQLRAAVK